MGDVTRQPKPLDLNLNGNLEEVDFSLSRDEGGADMVNDSYKNPFARIDPFAKSTSKVSIQADKAGVEPIEIYGADKESAGIKKRKWCINIDPERLKNIEASREDYNKFLKLNNNTSNKEVWKVYDHITADIVGDMLNEVMTTINKDLDKYTEKVIYDEF